MNSGSLFVQRPKPGEDEDDILALQEEWNSKNNKEKSVKIQRMTKKGSSQPGSVVSSQPSPRSNERFNNPAKFTLDLDEIVEENFAPVVCDVEEKNLDWMNGNRSEDIIKQGLERLRYSKDEGFPDILDLKAYFMDVAEKRKAPPKKSFFAAEFDRLHGRIDESSVPFTTVEEPESDKEDDPYASNEDYIKSLSVDKIMELRKDIQERIDPKMIDFLKSRYKKKVDAPKPKVSKFKQKRLEETTNDCSTASESKELPQRSRKLDEPSTSSCEIKEQNVEKLESKPSTSKDAPVVEDIIKQLEVLDEFADRKDGEKYNRLATDAIQIDFATKCLRTMLPRQQQNALKLFDNMKTAPNDYKPNKLIDHARGKIDEIKQLYLEEVKIEGKNQVQFARGLNPLLDSCWPLRPIRSVLDALDKRESNELTDDDLEIVQLSLLCTILLFLERPTAFYSFADPNEMYVRLAETFLLGSRLLEDDICIECIGILFDSYIFTSAVDGRLCLRMDGRVAELDAFMPFYEDFLKNFESFSMGDRLFTEFILAGSYLNSARSDSLECRFAIWSPKMNIARQITASVEGSEKIMDAITSLRGTQWEVFESQHYVTYCSLLGAYTTSLRDKKVTRERNPLMFKIASEELGEFVKRHSKNDQTVGEKPKEFDCLVEIIVNSLKDVLTF
ncbi:unnamed protein product [Auanema sp. JU1783]|nr:unnamed protein product [Auanema sp. JU1783]